MSRAFSFIIGDEEIQKSLDFNQLNRLPNNIRDLLFQNGKYSIQSNVSFQNLSSFLDYYFDESKNPDINIDNIYEYRFLSKEFNFNIDYLSSPEADKLFKISALLKTKEEEISDKSIFEEYKISIITSTITLKKCIKFQFLHYTIYSLTKAVY